MKLNKENIISKTEFIKVYKFDSEGVKYKIAVTRKRVGRDCIVHCSQAEIALEQVAWKLGYFGAMKYTTVCTPASLLEDDTVCVFVISGSPKMIRGLDNGNIASVHKFDKVNAGEKLFVMTSKEFKGLML